MTDTIYKDEDFVYVDPEKREVVSLVEWDKEGNALEREWVRVQPAADPAKATAAAPEKRDTRPHRKPQVRYYPWGSYRSMAKLYRLHGKGKDKEVESYIPLEDAIEKLQENPYWN